MIADAGDRASRRFLEFFAASIENDNTRMVYYRIRMLFDWLVAGVVERVNRRNSRLA
jgi:hypothetical protein